MKLVCISDTHSLHRRIPDIPDGDVLIHAGDCLGQGTLENVRDFNDWLETLPHRTRSLLPVTMTGLSRKLRNSRGRH